MRERFHRADPAHLAQGEGSFQGDWQFLNIPSVNLLPSCNGTVARHFLSPGFSSSLNPLCKLVTCCKVCVADLASFICNLCTVAVGMRGFA